MCVIVDVDVAPQVLLRSDHPEYRVVHQALFGSTKPHGRLVIGGLLSKQYSRNRQLQRIVVRLFQMARARRIPDRLIDPEVEWVRKSGYARSNDHHILGLARASGVRVLCSNDRELQTDFGNKALLD